MKQTQLARIGRANSIIKYLRISVFKFHFYCILERTNIFTKKERSRSYLGLIWRRCLCPAGFCGDTEKKKKYNSTLFAVPWHANKLPLPLKVWEYCHPNQIKLKGREQKRRFLLCYGTVRMKAGRRCTCLHVSFQARKRTNLD